MISLRPIARNGDRILRVSLPVRSFSLSHTAAAEKGTQPSQPALSSKPTPATTRKPHTSKKPLGSGSQNRPRPAKALDARAFAAPRAAGEQTRILRSPRLRTARGGKPPQGKGKPANKKNRKKAWGRSSNQNEVDDKEEVNAAAIEQIELDQVMKSRPTPVRYDPEEIDVSTLQETWPSLPTDTNARSAAVMEKLSSLSGRFPNGYVPPYELGRRLWKGQNVLFNNDAEKAEAMVEVQKLAQVRADKISQKCGDLVEPKKVEFGGINSQDTKILLDTYVSGKYPSVEVSKGQPAVLGEVLKNLRNNGTYQTTGKRPQFVAKVESLLASGRVKQT